MCFGEEVDGRRLPLVRTKLLEPVRPVVLTVKDVSEIEGLLNSVLFTTLEL
jgi:hypothetical protein